MIATDDIINIVSLQLEDEMKKSNLLFSLSNQVESIIRDEKALMPFHLNLLNTALDGNMKETAHSRFLWQLFRVKKILESFTTRFFSKKFWKTNKYVLNIPDKFRIDISLQTETDFFIFENKVNDAQEQCGQIYRYVNHALRDGYRPDHVHVLYLNSETHDSPTEYSLSKNGEGKVFLPESVDIKVISYKEEIVSWLEDTYNEIPSNEIYLKTALFQYLDYLKEKFHISKRYSNMNNKIQQLLKDKLFNEQMDCLQRLDVITDTKNQLDQLKSFLDKLEEKEESNRFQEWFDEITKRYPIEEYDWVRDNEYDIHIDFLFHGNLLSACLTIDNGLCWGIRCQNKAMPKKWATTLHSLVQLVLPRAQTTEWWPAWDYTSYKNGLDRFLTLMAWVIENEDQEE